MHLRLDLAYDAPPDDVFAMLSDPTFRERVCEAQDVVSHEVSVTTAGDGFTYVNDQVQRTEGLPSFAARFAGETTRAVQREEWPDRNGGSLVIETPGKPSDVRGSVRLEPGGGGTTEVVEVEVTVKVPLLGGKLEKLVGDQVRHGFDVEHAVGTAWLNGER